MLLITHVTQRAAKAYDSEILVAKQKLFLFNSWQ